MTGGTVVVSIRLNTETVKKIDAEAERDNLSRSDIAKRYLLRGMSEEYDIDARTLDRIRQKCEEADLPLSFGLNYFLMKGLFGEKRFNQMKKVWIESLHREGIMALKPRPTSGGEFLRDESTTPASAGEEDEALRENTLNEQCQMKDVSETISGIMFSRLGAPAT